MEVENTKISESLKWEKIGRTKQVMMIKLEETKK